MLLRPLTFVRRIEIVPIDCNAAGLLVIQALPVERAAELGFDSLTLSHQQVKGLFAEPIAEINLHPDLTIAESRRRSQNESGPRQMAEAASIFARHRSTHLEGCVIVREELSERRPVCQVRLLPFIERLVVGKRRACHSAAPLIWLANDVKARRRNGVSDS